MKLSLKLLASEEALHDEFTYLAGALLSHGQSDEENTAMDFIVDHIGSATNLSRESIQSFFGVALRQHRYQLISNLMANTKSETYAFWIAREIWTTLDDRQVIYHLGEPLLKVLRLAINSNQATEAEKGLFARRILEITEMFSNAKGKQSKGETRGQ